MGLLDLLADPAATVIPAGRILVVVAHPDDETIGLGGQLGRLKGVTIVHATDGAPRGGRYASDDRGTEPWSRSDSSTTPMILPLRGRWPEGPEGVTADCVEARTLQAGGPTVELHPAPAVTPPYPPLRGGITRKLNEPDAVTPVLPPIPFPSPAAYAAARRAELVAAMALAGVTPDRLIRLDIPDQDAVLHLAPLARRLADLFSAHHTAAIVTHAFEGGHPDHDALAFAVAAAVRLTVRAGLPSPEVVEFPLYCAGPDGWILQSFPPDPPHPLVRLPLDGPTLALKRAMMAAHVSQAGVLAHFTAADETFRHPPPVDFTAPPNGGHVHYDRWNLPVTGERMATAMAAALADLDLA